MTTQSNPDLEHYIQQFALDQHLNRDMLRCLQVVQFAPQVEIYSQAAEQIYIYFLVAGKIQVNYAHPNGKLSVLADVLPFAVIGDLELFTYDDIKTNVLTLENTTLLRLEKIFALKYGYDDPRFLRLVIRNLTTKLYGSSLVVTRNALPLVSQFADYLLEQPTSTDGKILLEHKRHIANKLGATIRHFNRILKKLQTENIIQLSGNTLEILDRERLEQYTEI
jgi:CRP/FNR family transcriptional regulator, putaive post-exponential-phase nitrogen-starvation regulator